MSAPKASLFVATYEMPRHLEFVCAGLRRQSFRDLEIFFCDDGSGDSTRAVIDAFKRSPEAQGFRCVQHVWQEHKGFRKCRILNEALRRATGEVCVFLDGDCIPHPDYVRDHLEHQEKGRFLAGRRVELGERFCARLTPAQVLAGALDWPGPTLLLAAARGEMEYLNRTLRVPWEPLRALLKMNRVVDLKGCNYSVTRDALVALNGFDEEYEGYGREDTDIEIRLQNLGLRIKSLKGLALEYHVWHARREFTPTNDERLDELKRNGRVRCQKGINK